jgi:AraC-like DNA-binding protein
MQVMPALQQPTSDTPGAAAAALKDSRRPVAALGEQYGYEFEAAFHHAFKKTFGMPPTA